MRGTTKLLQHGFNHQAVSMLYRKETIQSVKFRSEHVDLDRQVFDIARGIVMEQKVGHVTYGKGGIVAKVEFKTKGEERLYSVGVACAHLDAKKPELRESQLGKMIEALKGTGAELQLLSGDLNFRAAKIDSLKTRADLVKMLSTQAGVEEIFQHDTLKRSLEKLSNGSCYCNQPGKAGVMYGPTYKRSPHQSECGKYSGSFPRDTKKKSIQACFLEEKPANESLDKFLKKSLEPSDKNYFKNGEHQLGYLDRLCTCTQNVSFVYQKGLEEVTVSDHIPVINMVRMTV